MKITLVLSLCLLFSTVARADLNVAAPNNTAPNRTNALLRFIAENSVTRNFALGTLINNRCDRYMTYFDAQACRFSVNKMIQVLDFDVILAPDNVSFRSTSPKSSWAPSAFVFVAFKKDFINILSQPVTAKYLSELNQELYRVLTGEKQTFSIYDFTKQFYKTDLATARAIAALFQDTSKMKLHLGYLYVSKAKGTELFAENQQQLSRVIDTINQVLNVNEDSFRTLFYPKEILPYVNRNIYHFYVPLYLSKALNETQSINKRFSFTSAFMLTLTYEFITASSNYSNLYSDPRTLDQDNASEAYKMRDIFGGFSGANYGVNGGNFFKDFALFQDMFGRSTKDAVEFMLGY